MITDLTLLSTSGVIPILQTLQCDVTGQNIFGLGLS